MIELRNNQLVLCFPDVHERAETTIEFQRTLRIPDDGKDYPLPAGLGPFPLRHVDDFADDVPDSWLEHGGVMLPMYQSEAMWMNFYGEYPFAIKVATGKINAVSGETWLDGLNRDPQDYIVATQQPWLDGYCIEKGVIRQFVAMPLGSGYSAEEQITGEAEYGGLQIVAYPMKRDAYERIFCAPMQVTASRSGDLSRMVTKMFALGSLDMGLAPGGRMQQEIYSDDFDLDVWDLRSSSRCFVHLANSLAWQAITGDAPPTAPLTSKSYKKAGIPWFDYYADGESAVPGSGALSRLKSVLQLGKEKGDVPLPENDSVTPGKVVHLRKGLRKGQVREGTF
jgi:hypothetical protein